MFSETNTFAWPIASVLFYRYLKPKGLSCLVCQLHFPRNYTYTPMVKCVHHTTHFRHDPVVSLVNCQSGSWRRLNIHTKTRILNYMWKNPNSDHEISWLTYIIYKKKNISIMHICYKVCFPSKQMCIHISKQIKMKGKKEEMTLSVKSHENLHTFNQTCLRIINKVWGFLLYLIKNSCFFVWEIKVITAPTENMLSKLPNFYLCMQHVLQATKQKAAKVPFFRETFMGNKNNTETSC